MTPHHREATLLLNKIDETQETTPKGGDPKLQSMVSHADSAKPNQSLNSQTPKGKLRKGEVGNTSMPLDKTSPLGRTAPYDKSLDASRHYMAPTLTPTGYGDTPGGNA